MKHPLFCVCMFLVFVSADTNAQLRRIHSDPALTEKFKAEAAKRPEYATMKSQIIALARSATPQNTNAAAVKSLLTKNTAMLKTIYNAAGIEGPQMKRIRMQDGNRRKTIKSLLPGMKARLLPNLSLHKVITPPYSHKEIQGGGYNYNGQMIADTSLTNRTIGKEAIIYSSDDWGEPHEIGFYANMFKQKLIAPSDPTIVAVEMKLEYSFQYTGWDTHGAVRGLYAFIRFQGLQELFQDNPFPAFDHQGGSYFPTYRIGSVLMPTDSIETQFEDFLVSGNDSLVAQRYVIPGQEFNIEFGLAFPYETKRGNNGCYHYAEMILKKITIRYLKADEN